MNYMSIPRKIKSEIGDIVERIRGVCVARIMCYHTTYILGVKMVNSDAQRFQKRG